MAEKIFNEQTNYGWGLTFNLTGKAPAINKRIFDTLEDATLFANDYNDTAIEGLLLSVVADEETKNGVYFVKRIKKNSDDEDAILVKVGSGDFDDNQLNELKKKDTQLENSIKLTQAAIANAATKIGNVPNDKTIVGMISDVETIALDNSQAISDTKTTIDEYTINEKKISENPVLNTDDILIGDSYSTLSQEAINVFPGELITTAISKIEVMLANTTLALTAAINDLESKIGSPSTYDENGNKVSNASGLYEKYEELEAKVNGDALAATQALTALNKRIENIESKI
jgi:hypothetical protein